MMTFPMISRSSLALGLLGCSTTALDSDLFGDLNPRAAADAGLEEPAPPAPPIVVTDVAITEIAMFQGVKIPLMKDGEPATSPYASLVAGRPGLLRIYVKPSAGFQAREITAELTLTSAANVATTRKVKMTVRKTSLEWQLDSTMNFTIAAEDIPKGTFSFAVRLMSAPVTTLAESPPAQYPVDSSNAAFKLVSSGKLRIVIVPVRYNADGSGRLPDTSAAVLEAYRTAFFQMYPVTDVEVSLRSAIDWSGAIKADRSGWNEVLSEVIALRSEDQPASDVYYVGTFAPASSFGSYCRDGCIAGLATLVNSATDANLRAGVAIGFGSDVFSTVAAVHETGHLHGRKHAPCGDPAGVDKAFPYSDGSIKTWGYGVLDKELYSPDSYSDFMSYCDGSWVSDYTYAALLARLQAVAPVQKGIVLPGGDYRFVQVGADASLRWGKTIKFPSAPNNNPTAVRTVDASGTFRTITGYYYPYGDDQGGVLLVRKTDVDGRRLEIDLRGASRSLQ